MRGQRGRSLLVLGLLAVAALALAATVVGAVATTTGWNCAPATC